MALNDFLAAVAEASKKYGPQYGIDPKELQLALVTTAGLEGGLGDTPGVGDNGQSYGRFQFHTGGGHGSTLLNQGWTIEDFYNDAKVVDHWAPLLAGTLASMKQNGYEGGEAIRQAAFALEKPAAMYPADRFNGVIQQASGLIGGAPVSGSSGGSAFGAEGGEVDTIRKKLQTRVSDALDAYQASGDPQAYAEFQSALSDLAYFEDSAPEGSDPNKAAQDAFDNAIKLGDFEGRQADRLYNRFADKADRARQTAETEISSVEDRNKSLIEQRQAAFGLNNQGPRSDIATYYAPTYEDALAKWNKIYGVGEEPSSTFSSGVGLPGQGGNDGRAETSEPVAPVKVNPLDFPLNAIPAETDGMKHWQGQKIVTTPPDEGAWKLPFGAKMNNGTTEDFPFQAFAEDVKNKVIKPFVGATRDKPKWGGKAGETTKKWWNTLTSPGSYKFGIPSHATGTANHPGGPAFINENGPEMVVPAFGQPYQAQGGPHVANLEQGSAVIPADVPPDEAFMYAKIMQAVRQGGGQSPASSPEAQAMRARDPQLREKVLASLQKAQAGQDVADPPFTPTIIGPQPDLWADWRPLTGIPAQPQQQQPAGRSA